jgi:hypothetical protein
MVQRTKSQTVMEEAASHPIAQELGSVTFFELSEGPGCGYSAKRVVTFAAEARWSRLLEERSSSPTRREGRLEGVDAMAEKSIKVGVIAE